MERVLIISYIISMILKTKQLKQHDMILLTESEEVIRLLPERHVLSATSSGTSFMVRVRVIGAMTTRFFNARPDRL